MRPYPTHILLSLYLMFGVALAQPVTPTSLTTPLEQPQLPPDPNLDRGLRVDQLLRQVDYLERTANRKGHVTENVSTMTTPDPVWATAFVTLATGIFIGAVVAVFVTANQ